jgi:DNA-binding CsgD family transcriptional regulator
MAYHQGNYARATALFAESLILRRELGNQPAIAQSLQGLGEVALAQGDAASAWTYHEERLRIEQELGNKPGIAASLTSLALVAHAQGNDVQALALLEESLSLAQKLEDETGIVVVLEGFAVLAVAHGLPVRAAQLCGAAETLHNTIGITYPSIYHAEYDRAVALARAELGESLFTAAWAEGQAMTPEQALSASSPSPPPVSQPAYPAGLTPREVAVLRLVAQGLTNAQVADKLVISPRTVDTHLTAIYGKLGVTSRSAATRFAVEHHLA